MIANKFTIIMHIFSYLAIIIVNATAYTLHIDGPRAIQISIICAFIVYFVCTLIFGLIVNIIVTKIIAVHTQGSESIESAPSYALFELDSNCAMPANVIYTACIMRLLIGTCYYVEKMTA